MKDIQRVLALEDTVLFVGSGVSLWSGLPTWVGFVEELAQFLENAGLSSDLVRSELQRGDLLQAASYGFYELTPIQIGEFVRRACRYGVAKPHDIHRKLVHLGPTCFVTTNYDNLIEEALRTWRSNRFYRPPVTNRHLTETAELVYSRATNFVFKPHGDASDSGSIVLTREQYRHLLPGGEMHAALDALKTLLVSRPVVYIGFGLRDPDFLYVRDLLANTYMGATRDHYAIVPDVRGTEVNWWRHNYGIHLIGYETVKDKNGSKDHINLLNLLDDLVPSASDEANVSDSASTVEAVKSTATILALARHAARLARVAKCDPEFPIRVSFEGISGQKKPPRVGPDDFFNWTVDKFLGEGPSRATLIGAPGAGKSYSIQRAAAALAERLHEACMSDAFNEHNFVIPVLADLKLYKGNLAELLDQCLPNNLFLSDLGKNFKVKVFLDSFNEMPREFWESATYESDFAQFIGNNPRVELIIGSRTNDGLAKFGFPSYRLDQIDQEFLTAELRRLKIDVDGRFKSEVLSLLQKPFYFQLVATKNITLSLHPHPKDLFSEFFGALNNAFKARFGEHFQLENALSIVAYEAVRTGEEAQRLSDVITTLDKFRDRGELTFPSSLDIVNWLIARSVLIPYRDARLAFFHQSATEYLAACEFVRKYQKDDTIVREALTLKRWDQVMFLALSLLPPSHSKHFLESILEMDFVLALNATKYIEFDCDTVVASLLAEIPLRADQLDPFESDIESAIEFGMPISERQEPQLRALIKCRDLIGAAAVARLVELKGVSVKDELLALMIEARDDYNFCCNGIGEALAPFATARDVTKIRKLAKSIENEVTAESSDDVGQGFTYGAAAFLSELDVKAVRNGFLGDSPGEPLPEILNRILCAYLQEKHSTDGLDLAGELLLRGSGEAATVIYFISRFAPSHVQLSWASFSHLHVERLLSGVVASSADDDWHLRALKCICDVREDLAGLVRARALDAKGLMRTALAYCVARSDLRQVFASLREFARMPTVKREPNRRYLLGQLDLDWAGHEDLFVELLRLRDVPIALALTEVPHVKRLMHEVTLTPVRWWLEWLEKARPRKDGYWFLYRMANFFATACTRETRSAFVAEFNKTSSPFRSLLAGSVLPHFSDLSTDDLNQDSISFLLDDLAHTNEDLTHPGHLLAVAATENFVHVKLLPLLGEAKPPLSGNLQRVLKQAGSRHGRRYIPE